MTTPTPPEALLAAKKAMRAEVSARLKALTPVQVARQSAEMGRLVVGMPEFAAAPWVMLFAPMPGEADARGVGRAALEAGKVVLLPGIDWAVRRLVPRRVSSVDHGLVVVRGGVPEPDPGLPEADLAALGGMGVIVTPGLAFDSRGGRLGRGGGFYDRLLSQRGFAALAVGFALAEQVVAAVPAGDRDARVDAVVTPSGVCRPPATDGGG